MPPNDKATTVAESILSMTRGIRRIPISELIRRTPSTSIEQALREFQRKGLLTLGDDLLEVSRENRISIALFLMERGKDPEKVCRLLEWDEFEGMIGHLFSLHGYKVSQNVRLKHKGRRLQIDLFALREPIALCVDCKHWKYGYSSSRAGAAADRQAERAKALASSPPPGVAMPRGRLYLIPLLLALMDTPLRFVRGVPLVPVYRLSDFLRGLPQMPDPRFKYFIAGLDDVEPSCRKVF